MVEHAGEGLGERGPVEFFQGEKHLAAPVGVLPGGAGKVLLIDFLGEVFLIERHQLAGGGGQEAGDGRVEFAG